MADQNGPQRNAFDAYLPSQIALLVENVGVVKARLAA